MVLILFKRQPIELTSLSVSVPLRGLWFLSAENPLDFTWWQEQDVSVPLRGLWFLSKAGYLPTDETSLVKSFRPLTGIMVLISPSENDYILLPESFRPLTGIMVLISLCYASRYNEIASFRPLTGIMVLIRMASNMNTSAKATFPSPYGDYGSYRSAGLICSIIFVIVVSVPLRGLWFLSAPLINGFIAPSKMPFAGRIFFSPHFSHFCGK